MKPVKYSPNERVGLTIAWVALLTFVAYMKGVSVGHCVMMAFALVLPLAVVINVWCNAYERLWR